MLTIEDRHTTVLRKRSVVASFLAVKKEMLISNVLA